MDLMSRAAPSDSSAAQYSTCDPLGTSAAALSLSRHRTGHEVPEALPENVLPIHSEPAGSDVRPVDPRTAPDAALRSSAASDGASSCTILVIEDNEDVRRMVRRHLESHGYSVLEAGDGQSGLDLIETHTGPVDLVLTDVDMPRIDGLTVAEVLGALRPLLGVVCMSGGFDERRWPERVALRPEAFLPKPFTPEKLARVIGDELARSQELAAQAQARQTVSRQYVGEQRLMAAVDLVAAAHRLQSRHIGRGSPAMRAGVAV